MMRHQVPYVMLDFSGKVLDMSSQWDMTLIKDLLDGDMWKTAQGYDFFKCDYIETLANNKGAVVIVPGRQNVGNEEIINEYINALEWCVLIITGDEERLFDISKLQHTNLKLWLMQPTLDDKADFYLGSGYAPEFKANIAHCEADYLEKPFDWFFSGQVNHERREVAANVLNTVLQREGLTGDLHESEGFTQGLEPANYTIKMAKAKAVPAPSGIQSPDSFRVFEALEAGAVPIADDLSTVLVHQAGYWRKVFNGEDVPFKILTDYANLEGYLLDVQREYPRYNNQVFAWWQNYKRRMAYTLAEHVNQISDLPYIQDDVSERITILILTSPIKSHPNTEIIEKTIADMRAVLPDCEIIIGIDGVRAEQEDYRERYEEYKKRLLWKTAHEWTNVVPVVFENHMHQAAMTRKLLTMVKTETILFVEHDTALCTDFTYEWNDLLDMIKDGTAYTIRFHHEGAIPEEHRYLMAGDVEEINDIPMIKTAQWSQRPHLSSTVFYREMMNRYFTDESRTMIEDKIHGFPAEAYKHDGLQGWYQWRLWIYHPTDGNIKRSYTSDGRGDDPKYEMEF